MGDFSDFRPISLFKGKYNFLSNFHSIPPAGTTPGPYATFTGGGGYVCLDGEKYPTVENAYQAAKTLDSEKRKAFMVSFLAEKLLETFPRPLIEGNSWGDIYWGRRLTADGVGEGLNHLGRLLENIRDELWRDGVPGSGTK